MNKLLSDAGAACFRSDDGEAPAPAPVTTTTSHNNAIVTIATAESSFEMRAGDNLLDALLAHGYEVDYQCRSGYCGSCRTILNNGAVDYDDFPLAHIHADEILPCCCRVTESLTIESKLRVCDNDGQESLFEKN